MGGLVGERGWWSRAVWWCVAGRVLVSEPTSRAHWSAFFMNLTTTDARSFWTSSARHTTHVADRWIFAPSLKRPQKMVASSMASRHSLHAVS